MNEVRGGAVASEVVKKLLGITTPSEADTM